MILAGDIGGTKIHLALFRRERGRLEKGPEAFFATADTSSAGAVIRTFCEGERERPSAAVLGIAGPVVGDAVRGVNLPWVLRVDEVSDAIGGGPVRLVNDLEAAAYGLSELDPDDLVTLQTGVVHPHGNRGLVSPGTGLGECILVFGNGHWIAAASEGGHADFAPRTDEEIELLRWLRSEYGRASAERVLSGPGLANVFRWLRERGDPPDDSGIPTDAPAADLPALVSTAALTANSRLAREAMRVWVTSLGAEAGNHALRGLTVGGLFLGGGIPARILPALREPWFLEAFHAKTPHEDLLRSVPVHVVVRAETPLLGAARLAEDLAGAG